MDDIIVKITPQGLGNILFMVFAGFIVAKEKNLKLKLLFPDKQQHNINNFDYYNIFFKTIATRLLKLENTEVVFVPAFSKWDPEKIKPGSIMESYFQYYPPIEKHESDIRNILLDSLYPYRQTLLENGDFKDRIFLHIRRGDYLLFPNYWFLPTIEYYKRAVNILKPMKPVIIVTNDIDWVKNNEYFNDTRYFEIFEGNEIETLALMSLCTAGAICANSTFSWWGAFLGTHSERNTVIIPNNWVGDNIHCLFPKEWVAIDST